MTPSEDMLKPENAEKLRGMLKRYNEMELEAMKDEQDILREIREEKKKESAKK